MKTAVVGLGAIGKIHADILAAKGMNLCAVCDTDKSKLADYSAEKYVDYITMLDEVRPQVVHICTPHYLHADMIIAALERNINVLCEKPLCIKSEDIDRILAAEKRSGAMLGVCHQNRYNEVNVFARDYLRGKKVISGCGSVAWSRDAAYYASGDWRGKWATEGGGVLINQALHTLDLMQMLAGFPDYVAADISNLSLSGVIEVEDTASAVFSGNSDFTFFATNASSYNFPVEITIRTESETVKIFSDAVYVNGEKKHFAEDTRYYGKCCYGTGHEKLFDDFYGCVKSGGKFGIDGEEAAKVVKMILACYKSGGKKVGI